MDNAEILIKVWFVPILLSMFCIVRGITAKQSGDEKELKIWRTLGLIFFIISIGLLICYFLWK